MAKSVKSEKNSKVEKMDRFCAYLDCEQTTGYNLIAGRTAASYANGKKIVFLLGGNTDLWCEVGHAITKKKLYEGTVF